MDKKNIFFFAKLLVLTVFLYGCQNSDEKAANSPRSQKQQIKNLSTQKMKVDDTPNLITNDEMSQNIQVSLSLANSKVVLYEPIILNFHIQNDSNQNIKLDLGQNSKQGFIFTIVYPDGKVSQLPQLTRNGISTLGNVLVKPQQTYNQKILLNEWINFDSTGSYKIEGRLAEPIKTEDGKILVINSNFNTTVNVQPENAERLKRVSAALVQSISESDNWKENSEAALTLGYVRHPIAVPFLQKVLTSKRLVEPIAIKGLERIGNEEAVQVLIAFVKEKPESELALLSKSALQEIENQSSDPAIKQKIKQFLYSK